MPVASRPPIMREFHGYAAADKANDSRELLVYSEELLPFLQGEIKAREIDNQVNTSNGKDSFQGTVKTTNCITCIYKDDASNRAFPPDVRKGEQVLIYNLGDTGTWYWKSEGRNDNNRKTETQRIQISGTLENAPELNDDNTYFIELDTRRSHRIRISTSNTDGEKNRYLIQIDSDQSQIFIGDDKGNQFFMDSEHPRVCMKNKKGSLLDLNDENIVLACKQDITIKAENGKCNIISGNDMTLKTDTNMLLDSGQNMTQTIGQNWSVSYNGTGVCSGKGSMTMSTAHLSVRRS